MIANGGEASEENHNTLVETFLQIALVNTASKKKEAIDKYRCSRPVRARP
jgi:hypothetical protein